MDDPETRDCEVLHGQLRVTSPPARQRPKIPAIVTAAGIERECQVWAKATDGRTQAEGGEASKR